MDVMAFVREHPIWTATLLIAAVIAVLAIFPWIQKSALDEEAERVHFPKDRPLTPEALEAFEREQGLITDRGGESWSSGES